MSINHYEILGVSPDSDFVQITAAWKRLLKKYHPDINQGDEDANEQTKLVNNAYSVLSDSKRRKKFDKELLSRRRIEKNPAKTHMPPC
jgi:curved DNA-binding protein